jgi:hypothetical protein
VHWPPIELIWTIAPVDLLDRADRPVAGVVDDHVQAPEPRDRRCDRGSGIAGTGDVELLGEDSIGRALHQIVKPPGLPGGGDDHVPVIERGLGEAAAETGGGTGDQPYTWFVLGHAPRIRARRRANKGQLLNPSCSRTT